VVLPESKAKDGWLALICEKPRRAKPVRRATAHRAGSEVARSNRYHAVSVQCGPACAATSLTLEGRRFLSAEAPVLPQPTCSPANCQCRYVHHDDRRAGLREPLRASLPDGVMVDWEVIISS